MSIHQQKAVRTSIDLPFMMHKNIKLACVEDGISMHACVINLLEKWYTDRTDQKDMEIAAQAEKDIAEHGSISLEEWERLNVQD